MGDRILVDIDISIDIPHKISRSNPMWQFYPTLYIITTV